MMGRDPRRFVLRTIYVFKELGLSSGWESSRKPRFAPRFILRGFKHLHCSLSQECRDKNVIVMKRRHHIARYFSVRESSRDACRQPYPIESRVDIEGDLTHRKRSVQARLKRD